jgi:DNA-binding NarL/FixJ family response regulator
VDVARSAKEAVQKTLSLKPDVVLLDLAWYKNYSAGISAIRAIKAQAPQVKILAATVYSELIEKARIAGADIAVDKDSLSSTTTLVGRIRDAYESEVIHQYPSSSLERLTPRELDVLMLVAKGFTDSRIADTLHIHLSTVKKHVSRILAKLGVDSRTGATAVAYEKGLIPKQNDRS